MASSYSKSTEVEWEWGKGTARGKVAEIFTEKVSKTIKGTEVTRDADQTTPAYLIEQQDGSTVLKSHSEVTKA
jgi:hypothetical protein